MAYIHDVIYPYISWGDSYLVVESAEFIRVDEVEDYRIKLLMRMKSDKHDFSDHIWESEETPEFLLGFMTNKERIMTYLRK
ncbi:unnamed protein product [Eruca vesicaria subsp. sativa]|uniref:Uncharacterized protein n=1 Tax=Eruca vesicaria subsp. sativa TaxID=29727 RepID=A0ABC8JTW6_ERUVS|nr:unnamed protein product [Eruca vesicaria subsp. sativa]